MEPRTVLLILGRVYLHETLEKIQWYVDPGLHQANEIAEVCLALGQQVIQGGGYVIEEAVINGACGEQSTEDISNNTWSSFPPSLSEDISSISVSIVPDQISENATTFSSVGATSLPFLATSSVVSYADMAITTAILNESSVSTESSHFVINTYFSNSTSGASTNPTAHELIAATATNPEPEPFSNNEFVSELRNGGLMAANDSESSGDGNPSDTPVFVIDHSENTDIENFTEVSATRTHLPIIDDELFVKETTNGSMEVTGVSDNDTVIVKIQHAESPAWSNNDDEASFTTDFVSSSGLRDTSDFSRVLEEPASIVFDISTPISDSSGKEIETNFTDGLSSTLVQFAVEDKTPSFEADTTTNGESILTKNIEESSDPLPSQQTGVMLQKFEINETQTVETSVSDVSSSSEETRSPKMIPFPSVTPHLVLGETTTTTTAMNVNDPIRHPADSMNNEYTNAMTVIFAVPQPVQMDVFWDEERNRKFRNFVINAINIEEENGWLQLPLEEDALYKKSDTELTREYREVKPGLQAEDLIYIAPSPMTENRNIYVAFFVRNGSTTDPADVVDGAKIFYAVNSTRMGLEQEMELNITRVTRGIVPSHYKNTTTGAGSGLTTKESPSDDPDTVVETNQVKVDTETAMPPIGIDNSNDPIKHHEDLKDNEYTNAVTVIFTVPQPVQMDIFWDEERNRKFRNFVINAINIEEEKGWPHLALEEVVIYEKYDTEWVRKKRDIKPGLQAEDLIYIAPSPMAENRNIYVAFFIRNGSTTDPDDVVYGTKIFYAVNSTRIGLEQEMALNITRITPGIILVHYVESIFIRYAIVFIALLAIAVFCICIIIFGLIYIKCKSNRGKWNRSEYGDKNQLKMDLRISREMGNLHSDRDIQHDEAQGPKNGHPYTNGSGKLDIRVVSDDDGWVKPLEDNSNVIPRPRQRTEDTKL